MFDLPWGGVLALMTEVCWPGFGQVSVATLVLEAGSGSVGAAGLTAAARKYQT